MTNHANRFLTCVALLYLLPLAAYPAIVGAEDPKAFTEKQYREQTEAFNRRTILLAYQKIGKHDPKWDSLITPFLEGVCRYMAWTDAFSPYRIPNVPTAETLEKLGRPIYQAGCDDPMFLDMYSLVMIATPQWADALPIMKKASEQLPTSKYAPFRAANSVRRYYRVTRETYDSPAGIAFNDKLFNLDIATIESNEFGGIEQRIVYDPILEDFQRWTLARRTRLVQALEKSTAADSWLKSLLLGVNSIDVGWAARGEGWADSVTPEG